MAASSPALSNTSAETTPTPTPNPASPAAASASAATVGLSTTTNASKNLRGLNKPKCIKCGNVARSRCPYQSCKSCCAKAQNPCHIHVLKSNSTLPDKTPSNSPLFDQQSNEASPSGNSHRVASLRQLSNNFAQFNNLQSPLRSRKPLTRKDAAVINEWRFLKLKEYKDRNIETENEAFDRYMQNVHLLEEVFSVNSTPEGPINDGSPISNLNPNPNPDPNPIPIEACVEPEGPTKDGSPISNPNPIPIEASVEPEGPTKDGSPISNPNPIPIEASVEPERPTKDGSPISNPDPNAISIEASVEPEGPTKDGSPISNPKSKPNPISIEASAEPMISALKLKLRSNPVRTAKFRKRVQEIVDQGLRKLRRLEILNNGNNDQDELVNRPRTWQEERASGLIDLIDKLNKARNEEDLKACLELKAKIFKRHVKSSGEETEDVEESKNPKAENELSPMKKSDYSPPKWFSTTTIGQDDLNCIDLHFCSLQEIEDL